MNRRPKQTKAQKLAALEQLEQFTRDCRMKLDRLKRGIETQLFVYTTQGAVICAGVHYLPAISARFIWQAQSHWRRWRKWYDTRPYNQHRQYTKEAESVVFGTQQVLAYPVYSDPKTQGKWFIVPAVASLEN